MGVMIIVMKNQIGSKGFTLIELIIVIAILGILTAIMSPQVVSFIERAKLATDQTTVRTLNGLTSVFRVENSYSDPFKNISKTNTELIEVLVNNGYLSSVVEPQSKESSFAWIVDEEKWVLLSNVGSYVIGDSIDGINIIGTGWFNGWLRGVFSGDSQSIIIPISMDDITVTQIDQRVFQDKGLTSVSFASGSEITRIHGHAFRDNNISSIEFPETLTRIDNRAFLNNNLSEVVLPDSLVTIEGAAFSGNDLSKITIGSDVEFYNDIHNNSLGANTLEFKQAYQVGGSGTYVWDGTVWVKQGD